MNRAPGKKLRNVGASVRDRLTQRARANADNVQLVLTRYASNVCSIVSACLHTAIASF